MVIGFNMTFIIQHFLGLLGCRGECSPIADLPGLGWMNMLSTIGVFFMAAASIIFVWNLATVFFRTQSAGDNPGTHGPWNGLQPRRRRMRTLLRCRRSAAGARSGMSRIRTGLTPSSEQRSTADPSTG